MGDERDCRFESVARSGEGRALLETHEIVFRGPFRAKLPFAELTSARADGGVLVLTRGAETIRLIFPADPKRAQIWANKIAAPKGRLTKLGIAAGSRVHVIGIGSHDDASFFDELTAAGAIASSDVASADVIVLHARTPKELERLPTLRAAMKPSAALWLLRVKGKGASVDEASAMRAGRDAGLVDVKVASFSDALSAMKWVVPRAAR